MEANSGSQGRAIDSPLEAFVGYSWDDNDYYLNSDAGVTATASTMPGFEGHYVAGLAAYGLQGAPATGYATATYAAGTLEGLSCQAIVASTSTPKLVCVVCTHG